MLLLIFPGIYRLHLGGSLVGVDLGPLARRIFLRNEASLGDLHGPAIRDRADGSVYAVANFAGGGGGKRTP